MKYLMVALVVISGLSVSACNTAEGIGKDLRAGGQKLEEIAK